MNYERIINVIEPGASIIRHGDHPVVIETEKYGKATLQHCDAGYREYPRIGLFVAFDEINGLAFVSDDPETDAGRPYRF